MNSSEIKHAFLSWNEQGTPVSREFDDVYFSNDDGLEETRYVFLTGNSLPERFVSHSTSCFTIAESGFGTGLNFLTLWQSFRNFLAEQPDAKVRSVRFISFEKFPLRREDLEIAHRVWPEFAEQSAKLCAQWPAASPGCHRLAFDNDKVILELWFGDINQVLPQVGGEFDGGVDCWFLDGFAPAKNPEMWSEILFREVAKTTKPGGTFATFTAAGFVRRGLQAAGFEVKRVKGFGHKREMLTGVRR